MHAVVVVAAARERHILKREKKLLKFQVQKAPTPDLQLGEMGCD